MSGVLEHQTDTLINSYDWIDLKIIDKLDDWKIEYKLYFISELDRFFKDPKFYKETKSLRIPDGSPIGIYDCDLNFLWK